MRPNVLVVVFDAARRDALEPYGARPGSSPTVAQLAGRGRAVESVYATAPWTVPSHASMLTGLMPRAAGLSRVDSPSAVRASLAPHRDRLLAEVFRKAGYSTSAASANLWLSRTTGFDHGFQDFAEIDTNRNGQIHRDSVRQRLLWYAEAMRARVDDGAEQIESTIRGWADDATRRPFFWFVNLLECHSPYLPPRPYGGWAPLARMRAARDARRHYTLAGFWRACAGVEELSPETLERVRGFYAASIRYMDDWLGRILGLLEAQRLLDETLVVVLSDHGENFGEDGLIGHGMSLDNRLVNVPLVVAGPGAESFQLASLLGLPRAIATASGIEHPWSDESPAGYAIAQADPPVSAGETEKLEKLRGIGIDGKALERFVTPLTCSIHGGRKLLRRGSEEVVYDLATDPRESKPISVEEFGAERGKELGELRKALEFGAHAIAEKEVSSGPAPSEEEVRGLEERMKLLGYM